MSFQDFAPIISLTAKWKAI